MFGLIITTFGKLQYSGLCLWLVIGLNYTVITEGEGEGEGAGEGAAVVVQSVATVLHR